MTKTSFDDVGTPSASRLGVLAEHACFGERALVDLAPRAATVSVLSERVVCYELTRDDFEERNAGAELAPSASRRTPLVSQIVRRRKHHRRRTSP